MHHEKYRTILAAASFGLFALMAPALSASPEENKKVVQDYYAAYASGDIEKVSAFFTDDIDWHIPGRHPLAGTKTGKAEVTAFFAELGKSNFRSELIALTADENWVIDMHRGWSNREGGFNVDTVWALAFRIEDGKITEARNFAFDQSAADSFFWKAYPLKPLPERLAE